MDWFGIGPGLEIGHIIKGFDWANLGTATVVDLGGSHGASSTALAQEFPDLSCIVQDRNDVIKAGQAKLPSALTSQVLFLEHDFFQAQPIEAAAVYVLRWVLHDWSDTYAIKILRALIPALSNTSKILICEVILPRPGTTSMFRDRSARALDLARLEFHNGKERDQEDWIELLRKADHRFLLVEIRQPSGSRLSFLQVEWRDTHPIDSYA
ncbi:MAG: hypothetical protein Q9166_007718 [cf. Caloplaca sp. 2 TL-2023]